MNKQYIHLAHSTLKPKPYKPQKAHEHIMSFSKAKPIINLCLLTLQKQVRL
jgi:hypothetical protein